MDKVRAVFQREFAGYFNTSLGYIVLAVFLLCFGFFFFYVVDVLGSQVASMRGLFQLAPLILAVLTPVVTMRLVAEERANGTIELLLTLPLTEWQVVLGKYLAAISVVTLATALTLPYAATLMMLGDLDPGPVVGGYFGLLLMAGGYVALGLICSCITSSQVVAALWALLLCIGFWIADKLAAGLPGGLISDSLRSLGFGYHFRNIQRGVLDSRDLVYFLSVIVVSLALSVLVLRRQRLRG